MRIVMEGNHRKTNVDCNIYETRKGYRLVVWSVIPWREDKDWCTIRHNKIHKNVKACMKAMNRMFPGRVWWTKKEISIK